MSDVLEILKRGDNSLEALLRALLLDSENKVPAERLRIVGALAEGAIIESGSNANGEYVRFANGLQVCMSTINVTGINVQETLKIWAKEDYTPPAAFTGEPYVFITRCDARTSDNKRIHAGFSTHGTAGMVIWNTGESPDFQHPGVAVRGEGSSGLIVASATVQVVAIGKWK